MTDHATAQPETVWEDPETVTSPADIAEEDMRDIYAYWCGLKQRSGQPLCADFDVLDLPRHLLPHIYYLEYFAGKDDFLQRVLGTQIEQNTGLTMTGRFVSELNAVARTNLLHTLRFVVETGEPCLSQCPYYGRHTQGKTVRRISLPLFRDDQVRIIFGVSKFEFDQTVIAGDRRNLSSFRRTS